MRKWKRQILFWLLVILFFVTAPIIVLNARGYRFDTDRGVFVYSGTITLKTNPQAIDVSLNDQLEDKKLNRINNSYNLSGLLPGSYDIKISSDGYRTWRKRTDVHSGLASEFWNVLLVRENYEWLERSTPGIEKFFVSSDGRQIAYTASTPESLVVRVHEVEDDKAISSFEFPSWQFIENERKENIEWSPEADYLSVPVRRLVAAEPVGEDELVTETAETSLPVVEYDYFIVDVEKETSYNLNQTLAFQGISNVRWDAIEKGYILFMKDQDIYRVNVASPAGAVKIATGVSAFDVSGLDIYYSTLGNNLIFKTNSNGKAPVYQVTRSFPDGEEESIFRMTVYDETRIALISADKDLYVYNKGERETYFRKLDDNINEAHFSDDGKKMMFWSDNEIAVYYTRDEISQPVQQENGRQDITRYSEPIKNVQWFNDYEHVIFTTSRWTKVIELDGRDYRNCMDIITTDMENSFVVNNRQLGELFFIDKKGETTALYSIEFPEKGSILGIVGLD